MAQPVAFFEVISADPERARKFYGELFDWQISADPEMGGYALVDTGAGDDAIGGGIGASSASGDTGVKVYVKVDDLEAFLARAEALGGKRLVPPTPLPSGYGTIAVLVDPDGNQVGLWA